jgi:predicted transcriptional regulator
MDFKILKNLVDKGLSQRGIAKELEVSQGTVKYWLKKFNLKTQYATINRKSDYKKCPKCGYLKSKNSFYKRRCKERRGEPSGYCKKCSNRYHTDRVKRVKEKMVMYKGGSCMRCNLKLNDYNYVVFEFHHRTPKDKPENFNKIKYMKWSVIKKEIDKCDLLCANCHRIVHHELRQI